MLSQFVQETSGEKPTGMWCPERVWEPQLPSIMAKGGINYTVLDDSHFFASGLTEAQTFGYYMTEDAGNAVAVFPTQEKLRYLVPFGTVEKVMEWLRQHASEDNPVAVLGDDGEKFGTWPMTYEHVFEKGWLEDFFKALEENADWVQTTTFARVLQEVKPRGRIYLPTSSYIEMMTWALPPDSVERFEEFYEELKEERKDWKQIQPFIRGGFWRNFLAKYDESNQMHKRSLRLSQQVARALEQAVSPEERKSAEQAQAYLWESQCNCGYWHGVFGGLYLPHLRNAVYERIIAADAALRQSSQTAVIEKEDFDADGFDEIFIETPKLTLCIKPNAGGSLAEVDDVRSHVNIADTLTRRREAYHAKVAQAVTWEESQKETANTDSATASIHDIVRTKEKGLEKLLIYDWYRRTFGLAHFLAPWTSLHDFASGHYHEDGDFVNQSFEIESAHVGADGMPQVVLMRNGGLYQEGGVRTITLRRRIHADPEHARFTIRDEIMNTSHLQAEARYALEMIANVLAPDASDRYFFLDGGTKADQPQPRATMEQRDATVFGLVDEWRDLRISFALSQPATVWRLPIETVSLSEAGFERVYQGTCVMPVWNLSLSPAQSAAFEVTVNLTPVNAPYAPTRSEEVAAVK